MTQDNDELVAEIEMLRERIDGLRLRRTRVEPSEIIEQRKNGWVDFHPEDYCHKCGCQNVCWYAPSPIWNTIAQHLERGIGSIICPRCFIALGEEIGCTDWMIERGQTNADWKVYPRKIDARKLITYSSDGRIYNWKTDLFEHTPESQNWPFGQLASVAVPVELQNGSDGNPQLWREPLPASHDAAFEARGSGLVVRWFGQADRKISARYGTLHGRLRLEIIDEHDTVLAFGVVG